MPPLEETKIELARLLQEMKISKENHKQYYHSIEDNASERSRPQERHIIGSATLAGTPHHGKVRCTTPHHEERHSSRSVTSTKVPRLNKSTNEQ